MKWLPHKESKNQNKLENSRINSEGSIFYTASQVAKIIFCFVSTGMFLSGDSDRLKATMALPSPQELRAKVNEVASATSVRVLDHDFLGSGFIVQHGGGDYLVITNQHVLRAGKAPYRIETTDGKTYAAEIITDMTDADYQYDLAVLKFTTEATYETVKIGSSSGLNVGEEVFAAGFPYQEFTLPRTIDLSPESSPNRPMLALKPGRIAIVLDRALEEGYQIGYTSDVRKGMSGGALLNAQGEVIGINGKHAYPLWESPEKYQDGSQPCSALQELITRSSLAIPIEKSIETATQLQSLIPTSAGQEQLAQSDLSTQDAGVVAKMQKVAESTKEQCRQQPAILDNQ